MFKARYIARMTTSPADLHAAQALRHASFIEGTGALPRTGGLDVDAFDAICQHVLVEERATARLVATFRLLPLTSGAEIGRSYAAQYYDLEALRAYDKPMVEMGRFCIAGDVKDPDVLRAAWGAMTKYVDREGVGMLFGCSSFQGTEPQAYADAFAMLKERHIAPKRWLPQIKAPNVFRFAKALRQRADRAQALRTMPPLLRSYLTMGGWVSDHAVVDPDLNTLHVFTGLEIGSIPPARARALRAVAV
ncbi:MAG: GNAT family N-acetyltransferase [Silicimonas sp.]|nr:GNAT family N-acetyltransferase [Silicimonas sp.]